MVKARLKACCGLRRHARDEGGTLAEIAIMLPFLVLMVAAVTEFGRFFQNYTTLSKATRAAARYLSNQKAPYSNDDLGKAVNLVVCGKFVCAGGDELTKGMTAAKVCIEDQPASQTVKVSIPRTATSCTNGNIVPHTYQPIFDIGALLHSETFSLAIPISPSNTMYYINEEE